MHCLKKNIFCNIFEKYELITILVMYSNENIIFDIFHNFVNNKVHSCFSYRYIFDVVGLFFKVRVFMIVLFTEPLEVFRNYLCNIFCVYLHLCSNFK